MIKKMHLSLLIFTIFISVLFLSCRSVSKEVLFHRDASAESLRNGQIANALSHIDYAANACNNLECQTQLYRWMIDYGFERKNDVYRSQGYERLTLGLLDSYLEENAEDLFTAKIVGAEYLAWADSLRENRGDLFPLTSALLLNASVNIYDRPDSALGFLSDVFKIGIDYGEKELPTHLRIAIGKSKALIDQIYVMMNKHFETAKEYLKSDSPEEAIDGLLYTFRVSAALNEAQIAGSASVLLAEYYDSIGEKELAARWTAIALRWKGNASYKLNKNNELPAE
ncbi:hypothetical protein KAH81_02910 [bacterium]|nr:hypothetical protein [bacterium]